MQLSFRISSRSPARARSFGRALGLAPALAVLSAGCVPAGNSTPSDAGTTQAPSPAFSAKPRAATNVLTSTFEDNFDRPPRPAAVGAEGGKPDAAPASELGPNWRQAGTDVWHIENGRLCGQNAKNHGVWLTRAMPVNARIEFDATSDSPNGDLKAELWGDGQSGATAISYTNATSYLAIFGGWKNKFHALARLNEHGSDRKEIKVDKLSDDPREKPVFAGQSYHFKIERTDGKTVRWYVDNLEMASFADDAPLAGPGHEYVGFNDWEAKVCFDNVKITPLP